MRKVIFLSFMLLFATIVFASPPVFDDIGADVITNVEKTVVDFQVQKVEQSKKNDVAFVFIRWRNSLFLRQDETKYSTYKNIEYRVYRQLKFSNGILPNMKLGAGEVKNKSET